MMDAHYDQAGSPPAPQPPPGLAPPPGSPLRQGAASRSPLLRRPSAVLLDLKRAARSLAHRFGIDVRKLQNEHYHHLDPFFDQQRLLKGRPVKLIFDVGANSGQTVHRYHPLFPSTEIYCFEPFEKAFAELTRSCGGLDYVRPFQLALADSVGPRPFYANSYDVTNSLLPVSDESAGYVNPAWTAQSACVQVDVTTLDRFCEERSITHLDILKLDIQGGELSALKGAARLLQAQAIDLVYSEVLFAPLYKEQTHFCDLYRLLEGHGYTLYGYYNFNYGRDRVLGWCDVLFISRRIKEGLATTPWEP